MSSWNLCAAHEWREVESMSGKDVVCTKCGCPGSRESDGLGGEYVYWPAT